MLNRLLIVCLFALGVACSPKESKSDAASVIDSSLVEVDASQEVIKDISINTSDINMVFPASWEVETNYPLHLLMKNDLTKSIIMVDVKNYFKTFDSFVIESIRSYRNNQTLSINSADKYQINNVNYIRVSSSIEYENLLILSWLTVFNNKSYSIRCVMPNNEITIKECASIIQTLVLK